MPPALAIGVGWETFWDLNPHLLKPFIEADRIRTRQKELDLYVQGRYVCDAVTIALANGFRKKGTKPTPWIQEPYRLIPFTEEETQERVEKERAKAIAFFESMIPKENGGE